MKQSKNETGRSMVEMLGVLAVIGVLSVGGVTGYRYAMDQIAVNNLLTVFDKIWMGYLIESQKDDSILYSTTTDKTISTTASVPAENKRFMEYFCSNYVGSNDCSTYPIYISNTQNNWLFHSTFAKIWDGYHLYVELVFNARNNRSINVCHGFYKALRSRPDVVENIRGFIWGSWFGPSALEKDETIHKMCDAFAGSIPITFNFPDGKRTSKSDLVPIE